MFANYEQDVHRRMTKLTPITVGEVLARVSKDLPPAPAEGSRTHGLQLRPVKSYVADGKTLESYKFSGVVVPAFATHWGVVVGETLYHLSFRNRDDRELEFSDLCRNGKPIKFLFTPWEPMRELEELPFVGETKYSHEDLHMIGNKVINAFGDYHRLFWNCQVFAECFLRVSTGDKVAGFGRSVRPWKDMEY